jgi:cellulose synthase/poly-beta-1,6-N-acetylglucosamine synthase-like glycosyltransferase
LYSLLGAAVSGLLEFLYYSRFKMIANRIASQVALVSAMIAFTWVAIYSVFEFNKNGYDALYYLVWMVGIYYFYRVKTVDVLVLSSWVISGIIGIIVALARLIDNDLEGGTFLLFGLIIIGLSTFAGKWLMAILKEEKEKNTDAEKGVQA